LELLKLLRRGRGRQERKFLRKEVESGETLYSKKRNFTIES